MGRSSRITLPPHLKEQMHRKQPAPPHHTLPHCHPVRRELRSWGLLAPSVLGWGLPGFLPYSKKPHGSIKLHLLRPDGRPPRTQVLTEPGTLLANISEGRLGVMLEPMSHHSFASSRVPAYRSTALHIPLLWTCSTQLQVCFGNYDNIEDQATPRNA